MQCVPPYSYCQPLPASTQCGVDIDAVCAPIQLLSDIKPASTQCGVDSEERLHFSTKIDSLLGMGAKLSKMLYTAMPAELLAIQE